MYEINNVATGYAYWKNRLTDIVIGGEHFTGLPDTLPERELSRRIISGYAVCYKHTTYGIVTCDGSVSGIDIYNVPFRAVLTQPTLGDFNAVFANGAGKRITDTDINSVIIWHSTVDMGQAPVGLLPLIKRYARLLADIDASIDIAVVNARMPAVYTATSTAAQKSIKDMYAAIRSGNFDVAVTKAVMDAINTMQTIPAGASTMLTELYNAKDNTMRSFYAEISVLYSSNKKERMITGEIQTASQSLMVNVDDWIYQRREGVKRFNAFFGTNVDYDIDDTYDPLAFTEAETDAMTPDSGTSAETAPEAAEDKEG